MNQILKQVLEKMGVEESAAAILSSIKVEKRGRRTTISYSDPRIAQEFAEEKAIQEAIQKAKEPAAILSLRSVAISGTMSVVEVRTGETVTMWILRETTKKRKPRTKRILAQNLPPVKVRSLDVERIIVSSPQHLVTVPLRLPGRSGRISLPASERKAILNPPDMWWIRIKGGSAKLAIAGDVTEVREWLKRIREKYPLGRRLEISADEERWTALTDLFLP